jgi:hypothetical protein
LIAEAAALARADSELRELEDPRFECSNAKSSANGRPLALVLSRLIPDTPLPDRCLLDIPLMGDFIGAPFVGL